MTISKSFSQDNLDQVLTVVVAFLVLVAVSFFALGSAFAAAAFFSVLGSAFSFFAAAGLASFASFLASFMLPDF